MQSISLTIDTEWWGRAHLTAGDTPLHQGLARDLQTLEELLTWLAEREIRATFFCVTDDIPPRWLRMLAAAGHEVASHTCTHPHLGRLPLEAWQAEIHDSRKRLQDLTGQAVAGFRAPSWSVPWPQRDLFHALLAEAGYRYDSSFCAFETSLYGDRRFSQRPYQADHGLWEIPLPLVGFPAAPWVGGAYLRLLPRWLSRRFIRQDQPTFLYVHPWELYTHRTPGLKGFDRLVTDYGRRTHFQRLKRLVQQLQADFRFVPLIEQVEEWEASPPGPPSLGS